MIICESEFDRPGKLPIYSEMEVDYYAWIPESNPYGIRNHRLSLRKNLRTGTYEVYRYFPHTGELEIAFTGDLRSAIEFATAEWRKYHGPIVPPDMVCTHEYPNRSSGCQYNSRDKMTTTGGEYE